MQACDNWIGLVSRSQSSTPALDSLCGFRSTFANVKQILFLNFNSSKNFTVLFLCPIWVLISVLVPTKYLFREEYFSLKHAYSQRYTSCTNTGRMWKKINSVESCDDRDFNGFLFVGYFERRVFGVSLSLCGLQILLLHHTNLFSSAWHVHVFLE